MSKKIIVTDKAPAAIGPYSVGTVAGKLVFTAGQLGINPDIGELVEGGIEAQTRQALLNLQNILVAAGSDLKNVLKTTVYLNDINEFGKMNSVYAEFFVEEPPARAAVQAAALPKGAAVQIEAVAVLAEV
jgi:2-iminobutanoate/2-iminopropanoate deaminase